MSGASRSLHACLRSPGFKRKKDNACYAAEPQTENYRDLHSSMILRILKIPLIHRRVVLPNTECQISLKLNDYAV